MCAKVWSEGRTHVREAVGTDLNMDIGIERQISCDWYLVSVLEFLQTLIF